ncbi:inovirus-type Gp2 protein [Paraburkholderia xenovorans]|uniref:YagK/YfjJ domain-containing protein n=1 Tax=Paraburkholderia xenovorans TaxID=36873 RepID=UPI0038B92A10
MKEKENWLEVEKNSCLTEEAESLRSVQSCVYDKSGKKILLSASTRSLPIVVRFVNQVFRTKRVPFKFVIEHRKKKAVPASSLAKYFDLLRMMTSLYSRRFYYAPALALFFDCFADHDICHCTLKDPNRPAFNGGLEAAVFNDFVKMLREEGIRVNVTKKMNDWQNAIDENAKRLTRYVDALFERHARLMVVRVDLLYKIACLDEKQIEASKQTMVREDRDDLWFLYGDKEIKFDALETQARFDVKELIEDRKHLFENMRSKPSLFEHMVGYVWRIEWSRIGGYHLHVAFFFDGSKVKKDAWLGDQIGQYWVDVITTGRGIYHNCNRFKAQYGDLWGIGEVNYHDTEKRAKLMRALGYLAKRSQYVYVKPSVKCNLFSTGHMPAQKPAVGRPRKKGREVSA